MEYYVAKCPPRLRWNNTIFSEIFHKAFTRMRLYFRSCIDGNSFLQIAPQKKNLMELDRKTSTANRSRRVWKSHPFEITCQSSSNLFKSHLVDFHYNRCDNFVDSQIYSRITQYEFFAIKQNQRMFSLTLSSQMYDIFGGSWWICHVSRYFQLHRTQMAHNSNHKFQIVSPFITQFSVPDEFSIPSQGFACKLIRFQSKILLYKNLNYVLACLGP